MIIITEMKQIHSNFLPKKEKEERKKIKGHRNRRKQ